MENLYFTSFDNNNLFYRKWNFEQEKKTLILIHRGHESFRKIKQFSTR